MGKILVIQTAFIGDSILTLPMIQKLKEMFPESLIDVLAIPNTKEIFSASPYVNDVIVLDKKNVHKSLVALWNFGKEIKQRRYTKIYSPHRSFRTAFIVMQSGVKETFGFSNSSLMHVYKNLIEYKYNHHEVQRNLALIGYNNDWKILPEIEIPLSAKERVNNFINENKINTKTAAIAPGSIWNTKKYPLECYIAVIKFLIKESFVVLLVGGLNDKSLCEEVAKKFDRQVISAAGNFNLLESIELLKRTKIIVTNDSAPAHLGICANIPVLTLYCSTVADFGFFPYSKKSSYLSFDDLKCKPCGIHGYDKCPLGHFACGYNLKPERVILKVKEMLND